MKKLIIGIVIGVLVSVPASIIAQSTWRDKTQNGDWDNNGPIRRFDDNRYQVKCWQYRVGYAGGLSCLPWSEVKSR